MGLQQKRDMLRSVIKKSLSGDIWNMYCAGDSQGGRPEVRLLQQSRQRAVKPAVAIHMELMLQFLLLALFTSHL